MVNQNLSPRLLLTSLFLPGLSLSISNFLNLPIGTQERSWRLNGGYFLQLKKWGYRKSLCSGASHGLLRISSHLSPRKSLTWSARPCMIWSQTMYPGVHLASGPLLLCTWLLASPLAALQTCRACSWLRIVYLLVPLSGISPPPPDIHRISSPASTAAQINCPLFREACCGHIWKSAPLFHHLSAFHLAFLVGFIHTLKRYHFFVF